MRGVLVVSDEQKVYRILERPGNIIVPAHACRPMDGFVPDTFSEYRNRSVIRDRLYCRTMTPSTLGLVNSFTGRHYFALAMLDEVGGEQPLQIWMGNRKLADICAADNDNRVHLYVCKEQLNLRRGEVFLLKTEANAAGYRVESVALLKRLPRPEAATRTHRRLSVPAPSRKPGVEARRVALSLAPRSGACADRFPICTGVPLPMGHLYDASRVELLDAQGAAMPLQVRATGLWPDRSVRWLLLDFQHDVRPGSQQVVLRYGRKVGRLRCKRALATQSAMGVTVDTGAAALRIRTQDTFLPGAVTLPGAAGLVTAAAQGPGIELTTPDLKAYVSRGKVESIEVEDNGPLRSCVRVECVHRGSNGATLFRSTARVHAYAGKSWFRVVYTFTNDSTEQPFSAVRSITLKTRLTQPPRRCTCVVQDLDNHFTLQRDGKVRRSGRRFRGGMNGDTSFGSCTLAVRNFWQNYPKSLALGRDGIEVGICPDVSGRDYKVGGYEEDRLYYHLVDGAYKFRCGMSRTHDLFYGFAPSGQGARMRSEARVFMEEPVVRAVPEVYLRSGVVGEAAPKDGAGPDYENWVDAARGRFLARRRTAREYGMTNYGDWFGERRYNWGNMEYDTPWVFLVEYLRGGGGEWLDLAAEAAKHLVDIDTCHASPSAGMVGGQYAHCMGHVGGYYPNGYREMASASAGMSHTHTWVEGLFLYYGLTGDQRILENAVATCDRMAAGVNARSYDFTNCRDSGWLLVHMCAAYRATGGKHYLEAAHAAVERVLERQRESGGWERMMVPGHCYCDPPRHMGNASFMVGVLMAGLKRYHRITHDPRVRGCIVRAADYIIDANWNRERKCFRYTNCPSIWIDVAMNPQMIEGLGYAWRLSGSERIGRVLVDAVDRCFSPKRRDPTRDGILQVAVPNYPVRRFRVADESMGKSVSLWMRQAPYALYDYRSAKAALSLT